MHGPQYTEIPYRGEPYSLCSLPLGQRFIADPNPAHQASGEAVAASLQGCQKKNAAPADQVGRFRRPASFHLRPSTCFHLTRSG